MANPEIHVFLAALHDLLAHPTAVFGGKREHALRTGNTQCFSESLAMKLEACFGSASKERWQRTDKAGYEIQLLGPFVFTKGNRAYDDWSRLEEAVEAYVDGRDDYHFVAKDHRMALRGQDPHHHLVLSICVARQPLEQKVQAAEDEPEEEEEEEEDDDDPAQSPESDSLYDSSDT